MASNGDTIDRYDLNALEKLMTAKVDVVMAEMRVIHERDRGNQEAVRVAKIEASEARKTAAKAQTLVDERLNDVRLRFTPREEHKNEHEALDTHLETLLRTVERIDAAALTRSDFQAYKDDLAKEEDRKDSERKMGRRAGLAGAFSGGVALLWEVVQRISS